MTVAWPLYDLRVTTARLTLRLPTEAELMDLGARAVGRVLPPKHAAFMGSWTQLPSPAFERSLLQFNWGLRASWEPAAWWLELAVFEAGSDVPVGMAGAHTSTFSRTRSANTGSWLLPEARGRGLGKETRSALIHLLFEGLDATEVRSNAHPANDASNGVSRALGYREDGSDVRILGDGEAVSVTRFLLRRDEWLASRREDVEIVGLEGCRSMFEAPE